MKPRTARAWGVLAGSPMVDGREARVQMPVVDATSSTLEGYGHLIDDPSRRRIEIVRGPSSLGTRPVDAGTASRREE